MAKEATRLLGCGERSAAAASPPLSTAKPTSALGPAPGSPGQDTAVPEGSDRGGSLQRGRGPGLGFGVGRSPQNRGAPSLAHGYPQPHGGRRCAPTSPDLPQTVTLPSAYLEGGDKVWGLGGGPAWTQGGAGCRGRDVTS